MRWLLVLFAGIGLIFAGMGVHAQSNDDGGSPLHPAFALLDADGQNVLETGAPVSTMKTCGSCHDTAFIAEHSFHSDVGLSQMTTPGSVVNGDEWDTSPGFFGRWNPITYRYLTPEGDEIIDLTTPEWIQTLGIRHVGGGPAVTSRDGTPLADLDTLSVENGIVQDGELAAWDWSESGVVEMDCFLCHMSTPDNDSRIAELQAGNFQWANTATLAATGIVNRVNDAWVWNAAAFDEAGLLLSEYVQVGDPLTQNCGACHGVVHTDAQDPLALSDYTLSDWSSMTTGQVMSPQYLSNSALNMQDKTELTYPWDVHTQRVVDCVNCHYALNNPVYYMEQDPPEHLVFDPRRMDFGDYLYRPLHEFAKGGSAQSILAPELDNTLRRCESCHDAPNTHTWLPYQDRHFSQLSCETCHIPSLNAPALENVDWTVLQVDSTPNITYRGVLDSDNGQLPLITGYQPVLLPRENGDGTTALAPHNLVTAWFWVYGDPARPVPLRYLEAAWLDGENYAPDVLDTFDANGDGLLDGDELLIDNDAKQTLIADRLAEQGLDNLTIMGEILPFSINHNVVTGDQAIRDCQTCHADDSRVNQAFVLTSNTPMGLTPVFVDNPSTSLAGDLLVDDGGALLYQPVSSSADIYILGHDRVTLIDWIGVLMFLGTLIGVAGHGGLRYMSALRSNPHSEHAKIQKVYMYSVYERLWHWLQTLVILGLLFTGLIIHKPEMFGMFSFHYVVLVHNVLAAILVINAALALFYHLASGEIRQFLPEPRGFFGQAIVQAKFYLNGIFKNDPHPFEKTPEHKLNPLQQMTYFGILNVLLPLQVITGALMWGAQQFPELANSLGGLPFLGPFHTLIAWTFASFIVGHVYLTTTGHEPLAGIKGMMLGWDDVEVSKENS